MIPATTTFQTSLAAFLRGTIPYLIQIPGYTRAFSNVAGMTYDPLFVVDSGSQCNSSGGLSLQPAAVQLGVNSVNFGATTGTAKAPAAGNLLLAFMASSSTGPAPSISDTNGNVWTALQTYAGGASGLCVWWATANGAGIDTVNFVSGSNNGNSFFAVLEIDARAGAYATAYNSGTSATASITIGGYSTSFALQGSTSWQVFAIQWDAAGTLNKTFRLAFLYGDLNHAGTLPTGWIQADLQYFPGNACNSGGRTGAGLSFLNFSDYLAVPWLVSLDPLSQTVNDLDGGADTTNLMFHVQDRGGAITSDFPNFVFEGSKVLLNTSFTGLGRADYCTIWTGFIDSVASDNFNLEYYFSCLDTSIKLAQVIYQTADDGGVTSSGHLRTLNANPMDILLDILQNQIVNADGTKGLPAALIDSATITAYRDGPLAGLSFLFHLSSPPAALDFIKNQIMKPLGGYLFVNALGQVTVAFFYPLTGPVAAMTLGPANWTSIPSAEQTEMVNTVEYQFDKDDGDSTASGNYLQDIVEEYQPSIAKYGIYGEHVVQADGLRSAFLGYFIATFMSWLIFFRYGFKNLKFDGNAADSLWSTMRLESGDVVAVTHPQVPDRAAGVMGITGKQFQILDKKWDFTAGLLTFTMIDASYLAKFGFFEIAPNAEADYTSASGADQALYMFESEAGFYSNGNPGNILG